MTTLRDGRGSPGTGRLHDVVYETVKERLLDGKYAPGERLSAESLRKEFDVSRQPAMEALRRLATDGLIRIVPQVGSIVATYESREIDDFFFMFGNLEGSIAALAAHRHTPAQLEALDRNCADLHRVEQEGDASLRARRFRLNYREFHGIIHEMAHAPYLAATVSQMWDLSDFLMNTAFPNRPIGSFMGARHHDHDLIREALVAQDAEAAQAASQEHIRNVAVLLRERQASGA
jgi:DNA-binding GntR family transcriptional regulator